MQQSNLMNPKKNTVNEDSFAADLDLSLVEIRQ